MSDATTTPGKGASKETFVQMSALLTGFAADTIAPSLDPVDLAGTLFETAQDNAGDSFDALLEQYAELAEGRKVNDMKPAERHRIGEALLEQNGPTAQSVIRLWYLGTWYPPDGPSSESFVVSDQAYIRGLAWKTMQSHAMGYSTLTYGYWAEMPPPLTKFTGKSEPSMAEADASPRTKPAAPKPFPPSSVGQGKGGQSPASLSGEPHAADRAADRTEGAS